MRYIKQQNDWTARRYSWLGRALSLLCALSLFALCATDAVAQEKNKKRPVDEVEEEESQDQDLAAYWLKIAYQNFNRGQVRRAMNAFERALMEDPSNRDARFGLSTLYIQVKEYALAERMLLDMEKEFPVDYSVKNNIAWLYATASSPVFRNGEKAISVARSALLIAPRDYHVWSTLSEAYYVNGQYEHAQRAAQEAFWLAHAAKAPLSDMHSYRDQLRKCAKAAQAMSLME
ncbi:MAG: tetratricopeptide repeat protein [Spartobacteria bacterium]|nr:tetratricopeptide repeat protein [Spartobacteria bacterium]